jgi:uncharacterized RDD family membrane protein YckC
MDARSGQLDTHIEIVTPENIAFQYRVAGPFRRLPAFLIDVVIRTVVGTVGMLIFVLVFGAFHSASTGAGLGFLLWFVLGQFYFGLFEMFWNGQTPGKWVLGIRVVSVGGQPITPFQAIMRNILRNVDFLPGFYAVGFLAAMMNDRFQRLGDLAVDTMVVIEEHRTLRGVYRTGEPEAVRLAALIPPRYQASHSLATALAVYVERRRLFPWGRRLEIARHIGEPLRKKFQMPAGTDLDLLLCALYHKTFIADLEDVSEQEASPFQTMVNPFTMAQMPPAQWDRPASVIPVEEEPSIDAAGVAPLETVIVEPEEEAI